MKRHCGSFAQSLALLTLLYVALAFQPTIIHQRRNWTTTTATWAASSAKVSSRRSRLDREHSKGYVGRSYGNSGGGGRVRGRVSVLTMARASTLRAEQKQRVKESIPKHVSPKAQRAAKRAKRAYFRDKFASSSYRLVKLQQEDPDSYYIGFVGANRAGRGDALKAVEAFLKRATELKVGYYYKDVSIKLVDAGSLRMSEMAGKDNRKLGLLRRCDLLVHVVRCFDLQKPKAPDRSDDKEAGGGEGDDDLDGIDWPLSATPLEDIKSTIEDMAYADLQSIQERHRWFWRDKGRAYNEQKAVRLIEPELEDTYSVGGVLKPKGKDFAQSCLQDEISQNGTTISKAPMRFAIKEIGFLTTTSVVYVANLPEETVLSRTLEVAGGSTANVEVTESIARVAYAHADKILAIERRYGVPAVAVCLRDRDDQDGLGAKVYKAMPRSFLARDPKAKKAAKSASNLRRRLGLGGPGKGRRPRIIGGTQGATASVDGKGEEQGQETAAVGDVSKESQPQPA